MTLVILLWVLIFSFAIYLNDFPQLNSTTINDEKCQCHRAKGPRLDMKSSSKPHTLSPTWRFNGEQRRDLYLSKKKLLI